MLAYQRRNTRGGGGDMSLAALALERMHGNTHLPQVLGAMARYEATGQSSLRGAAEVFWEELSRGHLYATGGSTISETWRGANTLGDAVSQHGVKSFGAHDVHETCVSHNSMRVSRRLLSWGGGSGDGGGIAHILAHAAYYERAMLNAVLGTQRGVLAGSMTYMVGMGGGVSKASFLSGSELHHYGDESTHWCCQGSGIEAFARLGDSVFWQAGDSSRPQLLLLQSIHIPHLVLHQKNETSFVRNSQILVQWKG